ncbi:hypothetical protein KNU62_gp85 [Gordonia phage Bakery]|uniref:Uncharacterized protein n=1 Tax=Gordonia phage Bakery TaxID=2591205 RepID=A0A514DGY4_9CAUD|nr:hypothetical protein KNU62_gp85 [Gordonia phage Bakery]QDH92870.1 hypothetical protein SEA_BAKERY_85 [Gordonia phage Bakery]
MTAPKRYRKKPVEIEAVQWGIHGAPTNPDPIVDWINAGGSNAQYTCEPIEQIAITTLEGVMSAVPGDWIIRGVQGEFYPCKPDIFAETYDDPEDVDPLLAVRRAEQRLVETRQDLARANETPKT